ncbi:TetR/AcrR family transcriptional regulator [Gordonia sp. PDNC005]|uniref:TetR/AcrR family transcriptional regulator n=1 Tax=unclassified Gordonia (in: high G+C Gram-positive bacteria) TaxID=2657482 RepID=UPI001964CEE4|nr:TetR/AcrR family transcriptional regulator [Gordonia sp. PDNC005]QRY61283.1 TetR/AcrR family transcriptional regulator [Gordonia sp. PDNC005]
MTENSRGDTRERLLDAAADLIASSPGEDFSLREVCDRVGVRMPTLYHFFGNKQGLVDAVVERGFDLYLAEKGAAEPSGDPIVDLRDGWDAHVRFGLANPGFYTLMYGKVRPGYAPAAQARPTELLRGLTERASAQGLLVVSPEQAAAHVLATNIGVTLRQIIQGRPDAELSAAVRDAVLAGITGAGSASTDDRDAVLRVARLASTDPSMLGKAETSLFVEWLHRLLAEMD